MPLKNPGMMKYTEICHFSHPHHYLKFEHYSESPFKCDGCKEAGIGSHYTCHVGPCNFDLHTHCSIPSPSISHPFYPNCSFQFLTCPPGQAARFCNACEKDVSGFVYHCPSCGFDLHPCCAKLPMLREDGDIKLYLYKKNKAPCHRCGRKGRSWSYRSSCKKYNVHVACVKEIVVDSWHELYCGGGRKSKADVLRASLQVHEKHKRRKGKAKKCCEVAGLVLQVVISAVLGDPTTLIIGFIGTLIMSK